MYSSIGKFSKSHVKMETDKKCKLDFLSASLNLSEFPK